LFSWKVAGTIPSINLRLSDKRLHQLIDHVQSIPFPESKNAAIAAPAAEAEVGFDKEKYININSFFQTTTTTTTLSDPEQTLQAVEGMTPVVKTKEKAEAEENENKEPAEEKKKELEGQSTQLEATFQLNKVKVLLLKI